MKKFLKMLKNQKKTDWEDNYEKIHFSGNQRICIKAAF